jgi:uncharacterized protein
MLSRSAIAMSVERRSPRELLVERLRELSSCVVAFSGGVDSAVVAKAAQLALKDRAVAVTGVSASLAEGELEAARRVAQAIGIRHETLATHEFDDAEYLANEPNRCWHCKDELYRQLAPWARRHGYRWIANGTNADDLGDFRPGLRAAEEHRVRSPLAECGFGKQTVRELARLWELQVWDKPAMPCLSSRVVYGLEITSERLARIDQAERLLRELGLANVRVRCHHDELARLEVELADLPALCAANVRPRVVERLRELGFRYVTLDLEGFRSGSFQQLVLAEKLLQDS